MRFLALLVCVLATCFGYKIAVLGPSMSNSQIIFNARVSEALADAGNDVSLVLIDYFKDSKINVKLKDNIKVRRVDASNSNFTMEELEQMQAKGAFSDVSFFDKDQQKMFNLFFSMFNKSCRKLIENREFMSWLENEKFDVAFVHMYHACPIGVAYAAKIPSWVWLNSGGLVDHVANTVGVPIIPSYVSPMMMEAHDELTFIERVKSVIGHHIGSFIWQRMVAGPETETFRAVFGQDFPHLIDIAAKSPLVMVNSNELYDLPRPTLAKVVNIGGVGYQMKEPKPLAKEFQSIVDKAKGVVVFTFGSHAPAHLMPLEWKNALLGAFRRFPEYQFIWRYTESDMNDRLPPNVHVFKWLPQSDLLQNNKTKAFISHGGYNSLQETISAGVPLVTIALFGDQPKNSKIAEKHGIAVTIKKAEVNEENIYNALNKVLNTEKYAQNVKRMSAMVKKQPFSAEEKLVKWTEFLAEFKSLENLQPAGVKLNYFQYYSLDVYGLFILVISIVLLVVYKLVRFIARLVCRCLGRTPKAKKD